MALSDNDTPAPTTDALSVAAIWDALAATDMEIRSIVEMLLRHTDHAAPHSRDMPAAGTPSPLLQLLQLLGSHDAITRRAACRLLARVLDAGGSTTATDGFAAHINTADAASHLVQLLASIVDADSAVQACQLLQQLLKQLPPAAAGTLAAQLIAAGAAQQLAQLLSCSCEPSIIVSACGLLRQLVLCSWTDTRTAAAQIDASSMAMWLDPSSCPKAAVAVCQLLQLLLKQLGEGGYAAEEQLAAELNAACATPQLVQLLAVRDPAVCFVPACGLLQQLTESSCTAAEHTAAQLEAAGMTPWLVQLLLRDSTDAAVVAAVCGLLHSLLGMLTESSAAAVAQGLVAEMNPAGVTTQRLVLLLASAEFPAVVRIWDLLLMLSQHSGDEDAPAAGGSSTSRQLVLLLCSSDSASASEQLCRVLLELWDCSSAAAEDVAAQVTYGGGIEQLVQLLAKCGGSCRPSPSVCALLGRLAARESAAAEEIAAQLVHSGCARQLLAHCSCSQSVRELLRVVVDNGLTAAAAVGAAISAVDAVEEPTQM
uniref:Uncharacterized protein n=2 Tax=Tetradesmus obliquus TaxID=3088 RepID=A0A383V4Y4_TETOB|eukprot:jgi/Sobl393_1/16033/SZX60013.1